VRIDLPWRRLDAKAEPTTSVVAAQADAELTTGVVADVVRG
jgi:hypothetical protein